MGEMDAGVLDKHRQRHAVRKHGGAEATRGCTLPDDHGKPVYVEASTDHLI
uniref:Uncharacterized protein n=1 Tax=Oryza nivara TaxID=4536 RepID=A0A0E0I942_ORYNI